MHDVPKSQAEAMAELNSVLSIIGILRKRIIQHESELQEIDEYIAEQTDEGDKIVPRRAAAILQSYIEEDRQLIKALNVSI